MGDVIGDLNSRRGMVGEFIDKPANMKLIKVGGEPEARSAVLTASRSRRLSRNSPPCSALATLAQHLQGVHQCLGVQTQMCMKLTQDVCRAQLYNCRCVMMSMLPHGSLSVISEEVWATCAWRHPVV